MLLEMERNDRTSSAGQFDLDPPREQRGLRNYDAAIEAMRAMSQVTEPSDLVRVFATHVREILQVDRALLIGRRGLQKPQYQVLVAHLWSETAGGFIESHSIETRSGGVLAEILYAGGLRMMSDWSPAADEPALDLLGAQRSLMAFPLFDDGKVGGMVVLLSPSPQPCEPTGLCALAMVTNVLQRAIQNHGLARQLAVTCEELDRELEAAADVQRWLLPAALPDCTGVSLAASYHPAKKCGGDYYDIVELADHKLGLIIADVSGKGAPAAVMVAVLRTFVRLHQAHWLNPARLLSELNLHLCGLDRIGHHGFVTAFCAVLDPKSGTLTYASAGHNPPRLMRSPQKQVRGLNGARAVPLGIAPRARYTEDRVLLRPGDLLLLYTDGIVEAISPDGELFGVDRLDKVLLTMICPPESQEAIRAVVRATGEFCGSRPAPDDQALVALAVTPH